MSSRKLRHASSFLLERPDFKNVIFEKNSWAPSEVAEVANNENFKWKPIKNRWNPKFGPGDLENGLGNLEDLRRGSMNFSNKYIF